MAWKGQRTQFECGSEQAYAAHYRRGEPQDDACRAAHAEYQRQLRARPGHEATVAARRERRYARSAFELARLDAIEALIHRHADEFRALLAAAVREAEAAEQGE